MRILAPLLVLAGLTSGVSAQQISFVSRPDLAKDVASFPRLAPEMPFAARINTALNKLNKNALERTRDCKTPDGNPAFTRSIDVTMAGPRFVSFVARDEWDCGAHPDNAATPFVYDLSTGKPVDWTKLLPPGVAGRAKLVRGDITIGVLQSSVLKHAYVDDLDATADEDCKGTLKETDYNFVLWPDAKSHSLVIGQNDLPHAVAACGGEVNLSAASLRALGVGRELLDAIEMGRPASVAHNVTPIAAARDDIEALVGTYERDDDDAGGGSIKLEGVPEGVKLTVAIGGFPNGGATHPDCNFIAQGRIDNGIFSGKVTEPNDPSVAANLSPVMVEVTLRSLRFRNAESADFCGIDGYSFGGSFVRK